MYVPKLKKPSTQLGQWTVIIYEIIPTSCMKKQNKIKAVTNKPSDLVFAIINIQRTEGKDLIMQCYDINAIKHA